MNFIAHAMAGAQAHSAGRGAALSPGAGRPGGVRGLYPPGGSRAAHAGAGAAAGAARGFARGDGGAGDLLVPSLQPLLSVGMVIPEGITRIGRRLVPFWD